MKCIMCGTSYCSCKSKCSVCWLNNKDIYFINECINNWLTKEEAKANKGLLVEYNKKVDSVTMVMYIHWEIDDEKLQETVEHYKNKAIPERKKPTYNPMLGKPNPNETCKFPEWGDIWSRCIYCNNIKRYMKDKPCPQYVDNTGSTVVEN